MNKSTKGSWKRSWPVHETHPPNNLMFGQILGSSLRRERFTYKEEKAGRSPGIHLPGDVENVHRPINKPILK